MKRRKREQYTTGQSAASPENNSQSLSIEREIIKDTPFTIVGSKEHGYWLTMGKHRISQPFKTKKEAQKHLDKKDWTIITAVIIAFIHDRELIDKAYQQGPIHGEQKISVDRFDHDVRLHQEKLHNK